jgi:hypothetical protein
MIVFMVDDRALRFRQEYRAPVSRPLAPTPKSGFDLFAENYARGNQRRVDDIVKYGGETSGLGSRIVDQLVSRGVSDSPGLRAGALAGDIVFDPSNLIGIPAVGAAAKTGARVAQLAPAPRQAYLNSLMGRLYHGSRAQDKFNVDPNAGNTLENFFNANFFTTTSKDLAQTPGYGAGSFHRVKMPLETAEDLRVLDLYPGAPSVRDQFPNVADDLRGLGVNDFSVQGSAQTTKDLPKLAQELNNPLRYMPFARTNSLVPDWNDWFTERGVNAIRHQSGAATNSDIAKPVYAFFAPGQMAAVPGKTLSQGVEGVQRNVQNYLRALVQRIREGNQPYESAPTRGAYDPRIDDL